MTTENGTLIRNIFCMLTYAFRILTQTNYDEVRAEEFDHAEDLFAAILAKGAAQQVKHGIYREYRTRQETRSVIRGKLNLTAAVRDRVQHQQKLTCEFDELTENNLYNQILKTTLQGLLTCPHVKKQRLTELRRVLVFFGNVDPLKPSAIPWERLTYRRSNQNYEMLLNLCYLIQNSLLQTPEAGTTEILGLSDENMARLYEKFILEYYRRHHPELSPRAGRVPWNLDGAPEEAMIRFLPQMQTDLILTREDRTLLLDAKYYGQTMQQHFNKHSLHSGNLYQLYAYVKNLDRSGSGKVAGVLLYAKTEEVLQPDCAFSMGGNPIGIENLDLTHSFSQITDQLDRLADRYLTGD